MEVDNDMLEVGGGTLRRSWGRGTEKRDYPNYVARRVGLPELVWAGLVTE
jgi:hypothetical protein